jgi:inner membrane protein
MQGKNHVALALAIPLGAALLTQPIFLPATVAGWGGLIIGSLAPDIDGEGSVAYLGNWLPRHVTPKPVVALLNGLGRTVSGVIRSIFGHRKTLHWPVIGGLLILLASFWQIDWLFWFGVGYVLHILGDSLTVSGVPLLGPFSKYDFSFCPMVTGKFTESAFGWCLWAFVAWRVVDLLPQSTWLWQVVYRFGGSFLGG